MKNQADPPAPAHAGERVARYDSHRKLTDPVKIPALEGLDSIEQERLVSLVARSDRVDRHRVRDMILTSPRDVLLDSRPHRVSTDAAVFLLVHHLGEPPLGGFEEDVDCRGVCCLCVVFHNRSIIAQMV